MLSLLRAHERVPEDDRRGQSREHKIYDHFTRRASPSHPRASLARARSLLARTIRASSLPIASSRAVPPRDARRLVSNARLDRSRCLPSSRTHLICVDQSLRVAKRRRTRRHRASSVVVVNGPGVKCPGRGRIRARPTPDAARWRRRRARRRRPRRRRLRARSRDRGRRARGSGGDRSRAGDGVSRPVVGTR